MDFCQLLHTAKKNDKTTANGARYYSTKFEPPKKIKKENKDLSANIKKFLAKQEEEEKKKQLMDQKKKEELLALRSQDKKATRRVNVMLKRTKSANKSVIEDAVDNTHTAVTRAGPEQPDEDDYGYVSQEASAFYNKLMEKYSQMPEEPKFNLLKKKSSSNLSSIKNRVKAALDKEEEESMQPRKRKRKKKEGEEGDDDDEKDDFRDEEPATKSATPKPKPKPKPGPPPMSFNDLLKMAAQKQHEPIVIEEKPQEEEKLYTKKQKKELEKERELREKKERRDREREEKDKPKVLKPGSGILERQLTRPLPPSNGKLPNKPAENTKPVNPQKSRSEMIAGNSTGKSTKLPVTPPPAKSFGVPSKPPETHKIPKPGLSIRDDMKNNKSVIPKKNGVLPPVANGKLQTKPKEFPPKDLINKNKPRPLPQKQFPPPDVRGVKRKQPLVSKGRILDDDDEEYDSEMDDFIDDDPQEGDYSKYIKEIFGYDKARYRDVDDDVDNMESSFAQQMKEEVVSAKIGIMEDLEDIKKEEEAKRRKALMKKKMKK